MFVANIYFIFHSLCASANVCVFVYEFWYAYVFIVWCSFFSSSSFLLKPFYYSERTNAEVTYREHTQCQICLNRTKFGPGWAYLDIPAIPNHPHQINAKQFKGQELRFQKK